MWGPVCSPLDLSSLPLQVMTAGRPRAQLLPATYLPHLLQALSPPVNSQGSEGAGDGNEECVDDEEKIIQSGSDAENWHHTLTEDQCLNVFIAFVLIQFPCFASQDIFYMSVYRRRRVGKELS